MAVSRPTSITRFGLFELDVRSGELRKNGVRIRLQQQPLQVLITLLARPGEIVTREEFRQQLWANDTFVDFDHGLNAAVKRLRDALGESAEAPVYIETMARRGYRFIAPVNNSDQSSNAGPLVSSLGRPALTPMVRRVLWGLLVFAAAALLVLLRWQSGKVTAIDSVAVLPLENLSHDPEQDYFAYGMTDELITQVSKIRSLRVIPHTTSMKYRQTEKSLSEIAKELKVGGIVEGSVLREGDHVRISAKLIDTQRDRQIWANSYERDLSDVLKLQNDLAKDIAEQVRKQLTPNAKKGTHTAEVKPEAYEAYLMGFANIDSTLEAIRRSQRYYEEAIRKDPNFALAYVGLANCYYNYGDYRWMAPIEAYSKSKEAIDRALQLDEILPEAHVTLGVLKWRFEWEVAAAEQEFRYALKQNPNYVDAHHSLVWYLAWAGRGEEALAEIKKVHELNPADDVVFTDVAGVYYHQRNYPALLTSTEQLLKNRPGAWDSHYFRGVALEGLNRPQDAVPEYKTAVELSAGNSDTVAGLAHAYSSWGHNRDAVKLLRELQKRSEHEYVSHYMLAVIYAGLGEKDKAFQNLEEGYRQRSPDMLYFIKADLRLDNLRSDPRFHSLLERMGVEQSGRVGFIF